MRTRGYVYASLALLATLPASALAAATVTASASPSADVVAGSTVQVTCNATGSTGMLGTVYPLSIDVAVDGGTVTPATVTCSGGSLSCSGSVAWATSTTPGTYTATCTGTFQGAYGGPSQTSGTATLTTVAGTKLPPSVSAMSGPAQVVIGSSGSFSVTAVDPNAPPAPLTYAWTATGGFITPDGTNPAAATWSPPSTAGSYEIGVTVSNGDSSITVTKTVDAVLAAYQGSFSSMFSFPRRLGVASNGALFVVDAGRSAEVALLTARGDVRGFAEMPEAVLAVASGAGYLWATTESGSVFKIDPSTGRIAGQLSLADGPLQVPNGVAFEPTTMTLWIAETGAYRVRVVGLDGTTAAMVTGTAGAPMTPPLDVAVDSAGGRVLVLVQGAKLDSELAAGEPIAAARFVHAFGKDAQYQTSFVGRSQLTRVGGITAAPSGRFYVSDAYQGTIQVFDAAGASLGSLGLAGIAPGELLNPLGLTVMANGDLAVANASVGRVDRFGDGTPLPVCAGDSDCDGLPDAWEIANGLNPNWAGDALLDPDRDGLNNAEEYAYGTSPRNADTDGDGHSDGDEIRAGTDPNDGNHVVVIASGPRESPPGLVKLSAVVSGTTGTCGVRWSQKAGPPVTLSSATSENPTFIARKAGTYAFDAVAACGTANSAPSRISVAVLNVSPLADAGRIIVANPGAPIRLDAHFSSDANGDPLAFTWEQTVGAPVAGTQSGAVIKVHPRAAGRYDFAATATDAAGRSSSAEVPVVVTSDSFPTAGAVAVPDEAQAGSTVQLDASASLVYDPAAATFAWEQVGGPAADLSGASGPVASFVPAVAGRYTFAVTVTSGGFRSPLARVDVFVAEATGVLPVVTSANAASVVAVNTPVSLEASASGSSVTYVWKQVSGPAGGLTGADGPVATVVPFAPGYCVFEVVAKDGAAESRPYRVAFEARAGGKAIPQARASVVQVSPMVGELVFLDGRGSTGAAHYRWTQTAGPWVPINGDAQVTWFRPPASGLYAFELEVDDGTVRSKPARVEIDVASAGGVQ